MNIYKNAKLTMEYLLYGDMDYKKAVEVDIKTYKEDQNGFILVAFPEINGKPSGFPLGMAHALKNSTMGDMKVVLVGAPLYEDEREDFWYLMR